MICEKKARAFCAFFMEVFEKTGKLIKTGRKDREYEAGSRFEI